MTPEFWQQRWEHGEIGWHRAEINRHLAEHWPTLNAAPGCRVLVPLCGKSRDLLWLAAHGHRVIGVELSPIAAQDFIAEHGLTATRTQSPPFERVTCDEIELLIGDFFALMPAHLGTIGAIYDRAALIALPPDLRQRYAAHLAALVPSGAVSLLISMDYDQNCMNGPPFAVNAAEIAQLFGDHFHIAQVGDHDVLDDEPQLRARGLNRLTEHVFFLTRR